MLQVLIIAFIAKEYFVFYGIVYDINNKKKTVQIMLLTGLDSLFLTVF